MYMLGSEGTEIKATLNFKVALNLVGSSWIIPQLGYGGKGYNRWLYEVLRECRRKTANEETWKNYALFLTKRYHNPKVFKVSSSDSFQRVSKVKTIFIIIMVLFFFFIFPGAICHVMIWYDETCQYIKGVHHSVGQSDITKSLTSEGFIQMAG